MWCCWCQMGWSQFQKLLIYWSTKENGRKKRNYPVTGSSVGENALLMIKRHVTKLNLYLVSWTWFLILLKWPPVTSSQSNRAPLGCGGSGNSHDVCASWMVDHWSHHGCAADISAATKWCFYVNMDPNLREVFPWPCGICAMKI